MSQTPSHNLSGDSNFLGASSSNIFFATPRSSVRGQSRNKTVFKPVQSKVIEEANNEDIRLDVDDNEVAAAQEYFSPDPENEVEENEQTMIKKLHNQKDGNPFETRFKPVVFVKFFIMHMLFFCLLGPFIMILSPIFGWKTLHNQGFIGLNISFFMQSVNYFALLAFLVVFYKTETVGLHALEIYMMLVTILIRMLIISSKYAYQNDLYLKLMETTILSKRDKQNDVLLGRWRLQNDEVIVEEIKSAILRLEIDSPLFFFNFLGEVGCDLKKKLVKSNNTCKLTDNTSHSNENMEEVLPISLSESPKKEASPSTPDRNVVLNWKRVIGKVKANCERARFEKLEKQLKEKEESKEKQEEGKQEKTVERKKEKEVKKDAAFYGHTTYAICRTFAHFARPQKLETKYLYGYNLAFDLRQNARSMLFSHMGKIALLLGAIRALIPTFYRMYQAFYKGEDIHIFTDKPYLIALIFCINTNFFWANTFTLFVSVQDFRSKVWCFKQLGYLISPKKIHEFKEKKLYPTLNIFDPITLKTWSSLRKIMKDYGKKYILRNNFNITVSMIFYFFILSTFILQILGVFKAYNDPLLLLVFGYESVVYFMIFMSIITGVAFLNNQYKVHKNLLKKNKTIISDFAKLSHLYVGKEAIKPDNVIYKEGLRVLKKELGEDNFEPKLVKRCEKLISMIDETIEELEFEEVNEPFTVMGIKVDYGLLQSMSIGIVSVLFAVGQSFVNK